MPRLFSVCIRPEWSCPCSSTSLQLGPKEAPSWLKEQRQCWGMCPQSLIRVQLPVAPRTVACRLLCPRDFHARILEWVAISFSRESSQPKDWTHISCRQVLYTTESPGKPLCRGSPHPPPTNQGIYLGHRVLIIDLYTKFSREENIWMLIKSSTHHRNRWPLRYAQWKEKENPCFYRLSSPK